jgi:hypothetical protein
MSTFENTTEYIFENTTEYIFENTSENITKTFITNIATNKDEYLNELSHTDIEETRFNVFSEMVELMSLTNFDEYNINTETINKLITTCNERINVIKGTNDNIDELDKNKKKELFMLLSIIENMTEFNNTYNI